MPLVVGGTGIAVSVPAPIAIVSTPAPAPSPRVSGRAVQGAIILTSTGTTSFRLEVKVRSRWVAVGTYKATSGKSRVKVKRGTYRIVTDPRGAATTGRPFVVR